MNKIIIIGIVAFSVLQACGGMRRVEKKPQLTITPEKLNLIVNQTTDPNTVAVDYTLNIPKNYVPTCGRAVYYPRFVAPGHEYSLVPIVITGKNHNRLEQRLQLLEGKQPDFSNAMQVWSEGKPSEITMTEVVPFETWMTGSKLVASVVYEACGRKTMLYSHTLADSVIYIPMGPGPLLVKYIWKEITKKEEGFARFFYPINGYTVDPALYNNREQLDSMSNLISKILADSSMHVNRIVITGICSPDGPWIYNESLARKRAEYIQQYLENQDHIDKSLIEVKYIPEDWKGLKRLLTESSMSGKEAALNIVNHNTNYDQREAALRRLPQFSYIKQNFYPQLRRVTYEVYYTVKEMVEEVIPE